MQRSITLLATCALALGTLTSCNLDKDYDFEYTNETVISIADETDKAAITEYFKSYVDIKDKDKPTYFGKHYDAVIKFRDHFIETVKTVDEDFVYAHLKGEDDYVRLIGVMSSSVSKEWVGYRTWATKTEETPEQAQ